METECFTEAVRPLTAEEKVYQLLFRKDAFLMEDLEQYVVPFEQSGYLSSEQKLYLLCFTQEKEQELLQQLFLVQGNTVTDEVVDELYADRKRKGKIDLSEKERKACIAGMLSDTLTFGPVMLGERMKGEELAIGEYCPQTEGEAHRKQGVMSICYRGVWKWMDCFAPLTEEKTECIVRGLVARERKGELTRLCPELEIRNAGGRIVKAVRPPGAKYWGIRIQYNYE